MTLARLSPQLQMRATKEHKERRDGMPSLCDLCVPSRLFLCHENKDLCGCNTEFQFDVFLSQNSADKPRVRRSAKRPREAGLQPRLDGWGRPVASVYDRRGKERRSQSAATEVQIQRGCRRRAHWLVLTKLLSEVGSAAPLGGATCPFAIRPTPVATSSRCGSTPTTGGRFLVRDGRAKSRQT